MTILARLREEFSFISGNILVLTITLIIIISAAAIPATCARAQGKEIALVEETPIQKRDFTNGKAQLLFEELRSKGATVVDDFREIFAILKASEKT